MELLIKTLDSCAKMPVRATQQAAGYDLFASEHAYIQKGQRALVGTGIAIALPPGTYGRVAPRSGLSVRGIDVGAGVIDEDYRGEVKVLLVNHGVDLLHVQPGERIAQLLIEPIVHPVVRQVEDLSNTERGSGGFGSTDNFF